MVYIFQPMVEVKKISFTCRDTVFAITKGSHKKKDTDWGACDKASTNQKT